MRVLVDTSVIVEIDRKNEQIVRILKKLVRKNTELVISTITVSEILTGSYLTKDVKKSVITAKEILNQFVWMDFDGNVAEESAKLLAYLIIEDKQIEYQDVVIAATFFTSRCDFLLTLNKKHFQIIPNVSIKVYTPEEFEKKI